MGLMVPSARSSPALRPSGVAPVSRPPGWWLVMEMPQGTVVPPVMVGMVGTKSVKSL